jgi:adenine-specific DNA-methyltransferase
MEELQTKNSFMNGTHRYEQNGHIIFHADALHVLTTLPSESVDLIFVDPPYNIGKNFSGFHDKWDSDKNYAEWAYSWLTECIRVLKPSGSMYVMTSTQSMPYFDIFLRERINILSRIIWHYDSSGVQARKYFGSIYEPILFCVKDTKSYTFNSADIKVEARTGAVRKLIDYRKPVPTLYNSEKVPGNVWYFSRVRYRMPEYEEHPSQKPEALLERIILASSNPGDVVLDPFAGTFTTAAVAKKHNRKSISTETQYEYVKIGLRRVLQHVQVNKEALLRPKKNFGSKSSGMEQLSMGDLFDETDGE